MSLVRFKRGDTLELGCSASAAGVPTDLTTITITSQMRATPDGPLVATMTVTVADPTSGNFVLSLAPATTALLDPGQYQCDVQYLEAGGRKYTSETFQIQIVPDVTRP